MKEYDLNSALLLLKTRFPYGFERDFSFEKHTAIGCGGSALAAISPNKEESVLELISFLTETSIPYSFLGAGANVLPYDGTYRGVVILFSRLNECVIKGDRLFLGAGVTGGKLKNCAVQNEISGFEPLAGIPFTIGGAICMNAGIRDGHVSDHLVSVFAIKNGKIISICKNDCAFGEKHSVFLDEKLPVLGAEFEIKWESKNRIIENYAHYLDKRRALPKGRSMGCVFVNNQSEPIGKIIERCGLKGARRGKAYVSSKHANFIINEGNCATDVFLLIQDIKRQVYNKTGITLMEEVQYFPDKRYFTQER